MWPMILAYLAFQVKQLPISFQGVFEVSNAMATLGIWARLRVQKEPDAGALEAWDGPLKETGPLLISVCA